ncbi:hypothetical protein E3P99_00216 [Wallemia hederae]|uniref:Major facilitator superfamily (MFS) profile domain-containing protein n=1 Tax=Wallemia hederae TaxID=1540922 RepID=A0A4T0FWT5_9BASI|nr:hypothetical protein E3P99_00216 [Wallemia hederae]
MSEFDDHSDRHTPAQLFQSQIRVTHSAITDNSSKVKEDIDEFRYRDSSEEPSDEANLIRKLSRRLDWTIIPALFFLFCVNFLDRVNIGQAKLEGLLEDTKIVLGLSVRDMSHCFLCLLCELGLVLRTLSNQCRSHRRYAGLRTTFSSPHTCQIPWNMLTKKIGPQISVPLMAVGWAVVCTLTGIVQNYSGLLAVRWFLGLTEGGLFPAMILILTAWYPRHQQGKRITIVYLGSQVAGAFGGIFSYVLALMRGVGGLNGWRWIYIIEGLLSFVVAVASFFFIQNFPSESKILSESERQVWLRYLSLHQGMDAEENVPFTWTQCKTLFKDAKLYMFALINYVNGSLLYVLSTWIPTIISELGDFDVAESHLLTAPVYVFGIICALAAAFWSDKIQQRGWFSAGGLVVAAVGFIIIMAIPPQVAAGARFFSLFLMVGGSNVVSAGLLPWYSGTFGPSYKRAIASAFIVMCGNCGGLASSFIYPDSTGPRFLPGHGYCLALCVIGIITSLGVRFLLQRENERRNTLFGSPEEYRRRLEFRSSIAKQKEEDNDGIDVAFDQKAFLGLAEMSDLEIASLGDKHPLFR